MNDRLVRHLSAFAGTLVGVSCRHAWPVLILALATTAASVYSALNHLPLDSDPDKISAPTPAFKQTREALEREFPETHMNFVVLIEADDDDDARAAAEELAERLGQQTETYPSVFLPGIGPFYEDNGLFYLPEADLRSMAERLDESGPLLAILRETPELPIMIGALTHGISSEEGLDSLGEDGARMLSEVANTVEQFNAGQASQIDWEDLLFDDLAVEYDNPQFIFVKPAADRREIGPLLASVEQIRELARELTPRPGLRVRVTGESAIHAEEMSLVFVEAVAAGAASLLLVMVLLLYVLRSPGLLLATVTTLLTALVWTAGFAGLAIGHLNLLTVAFAVVNIGLGVDFGIHFALGYLEQRALHEGRESAMDLVGRRVGSSLVFCAITTAVGFYAFIPTSYSAVAEMGAISGTGIFLSLLATLTLFPALLSIGLGDAAKREAPRRRRFELALPSLPLRHPRAVSLAGAAVTAAAIVCTGWVRFDVDILNMRDPRVESVEALRDMLADGDIPVWTVEAVVPDVAAARELASRLESLPQIREAYTIESFLPENQEERLAIFGEMREALSSPVELTDDERGRGDDRETILGWTIEGFGVALDFDEELRFGEDGGPVIAEAERLRRALDVVKAGLDDEAAAPDLDRLQRSVLADLPEFVGDLFDAIPSESVAISDLPAELSRRYLTPDGKARVEVLSDVDLHERDSAEEFARLVRSIHPEAAGGVMAMIEHKDSMVGSMRQALGTAIVVIALLLLVLWRSVKLTIITMIPLFVGSCCTAAFSVLADVPFNAANVIVLPLLLGIGVDSGIHLVNRHRLGLLGASDLLHTDTARAVLFSALTTILSFSTLGFSNHGGIASLSQLLVAGVSLMLIANVLLLPAILSWLDPQ